MTENLINISYDITKKNKLKNFYYKYKILIFSILSILFFSVVLISFYFKNEENKKIVLSDNYIKAKIFIKKGNKEEAKNILKDIITENNSTYSTLALFLIINENLIKEESDLLSIFDKVIEIKAIDEELKNLIIFKKMLYHSNFASEAELLESAKILINSETIWKPNALLLMADYFFYKKEYSKAKEFYTKVLTLKDIHKDIHEYAVYQLANINNE